MILKCKVCGAKAWIVTASEGSEQHVERSCEHKTEGVTADIEAIAYGRSHFDLPDPVRALKEFFDRITLRFRKK